MYRGTTPTLIFKLQAPNLNLDDAEQIWVTLKLPPYEQTWDISRCTIDNENKKISITLTQEETLALPVLKVKAQIRILLVTGQALATKVVYTNVGEILKEGVIA